jgi:hypothetical protein
VRPFDEPSPERLRISGDNQTCRSLHAQDLWHKFEYFALAESLFAMNNTKKSLLLRTERKRFFSITIGVDIPLKCQFHSKENLNYLRNDLAE